MGSWLGEGEALFLLPLLFYSQTFSLIHAMRHDLSFYAHWHHLLLCVHTCLCTRHTVYVEVRA